MTGVFGGNKSKEKGRLPKRAALPPSLPD